MEIIPVTIFYNSTLMMELGMKLVSCRRAGTGMEPVWSMLKISWIIVNNLINSASYNI